LIKIFKKYLGKVRIWSLSYTTYFNLVHNLLIVSIWFITFQYRVNLVSVVIFLIKIDDMTNAQNKILVYRDQIDTIKKLGTKL